MSSNGLLTIRIITSPQAFTGNKDWLFPDMDTIGKWNKWYAIDRFSRADITLLKFSYGPYIDVIADCTASGSNNAYCEASPTPVVPTVCSDSTFEQVAYDACCKKSDPSTCEYASDGNGGGEEEPPTSDDGNDDEPTSPPSLSNDDGMTALELVSFAAHGTLKNAAVGGAMIVKRTVHNAMAFGGKPPKITVAY